MRNVNWQNAFLILASYFFYGWWDWRFLGLILVTTITCYLSAIWIYKIRTKENIADEKSSKTHVWMITFGAILINISILGLFKYYNFFIESFINVFTLFGKELNVPTLKIILPIGISFYTFTALSYTIDVYKNKIKVSKNILAFFAYVSFFPALLCGPIGRANKQLPQFFDKRIFNYTLSVEGLKMILWGLFMKLCVADRLGLYVDAVYNNIGLHNGSSMALAAFFYAFQLYCDFGGYSLMAIGTGRLFGITLLDNFRRPYFASSFSDYWKRNHISLTQWLIDYIYYPMVGSSEKLRYWNFCMILTFLISGLWHGAAWTFVLWGLYQGIFLVISANNAKRRKKFEKKYQIQNNGLYKAATILITFLIITTGLIFFRVNSVSGAFEVYKNIFANHGPLFLDKTTLFYGIICLTILILKDLRDEFFPERIKLFENKSAVVRFTSYAFVCLAVILFGVFDGGQFIYFKF